jgi:hypothetical protein
MKNEDLRKRVWEEMLIAEMRANYFAELVLRYQKIDKRLRVATLVASSGAAASVLSAVPQWVRLSFPFTAAGVSFWLLFSQYGTLSLDASNLHEGWNGVHAQYERVWGDIDRSDAEERFHEIYEGANPLSKAGTKFPNNEKRLGYWLDQAAQMALARYA